MQGIKEIKNRIKSVSDTQKITNAMYLVSSAKLTAAKSSVVTNRVYSDEAEKMLASALSHAEGKKSVYTRENGAQRDALLVLGGDRGMCGDYNKRIALFAAKTIQNYKNPAIFVSGERVLSLIKAAGIAAEQGFDIRIKKPDDGTASAITDYFVNLFLNEEISSFSVIFADFASGSKLCVKQILPVPLTEDDRGGECDFLPDRETLLDTLIPLCLKSSVRSCVLSAFCSEQNARMAAMKNANDNAGDLLSELKLEYNHTRQNAITAEITEISAERNTL